jgi:hypothetical protein
MYSTALSAIKTHGCEDDWQGVIQGFQAFYNRP